MLVKGLGTDLMRDTTEKTLIQVRQLPCLRSMCGKGTDLGEGPGRRRSSKGASGYLMRVVEASGRAVELHGSEGQGGQYGVGVHRCWSAAAGLPRCKWPCFQAAASCLAAPSPAYVACTGLHCQGVVQGQGADHGNPCASLVINTTPLASLPTCCLPQNIAKAVYKDKEQIIASLRKSYPPFKETKEFEFAFKIR